MQLPSIKRKCTIINKLYQNIFKKEDAEEEI